MSDEVYYFENELWTTEKIHKISDDDDDDGFVVTFGELKYSEEEVPTQIGVGLQGAYLYLNEDEIDQYIQDLRYIASIIFDKQRKPSLSVVTDDDSAD